VATFMNTGVLIVPWTVSNVEALAFPSKLSIVYFAILL